MIEDSRLGVIYGLSCLCHPERGFRYVGQTVSKASQRRNQHVSDSFNQGTNLPVHNWIRKHGSEDRSNIVVSIIESGVPLHQIDEREIYWIAHFKTVVPGGMNITAGGGGSRGRRFEHTEEWRKAMSERYKGRKPSQSTIAGVRKRMAKMTGADNYNAKLNDGLVAEIVSMIFSGVSPMKIASDLGLDHTTIYQIRNNKTWKHIPRPIGPRPRVKAYRGIPAKLETTSRTT